MPEKTTRTLNIRELLPFLALLPGLLLVLYYLLGPASGYMTSDCTDSIRWAQATYESGHLISKNFSYAAVQPFGGNLIFLPFVALFGYSMTAQIAGLVLFALLFVFALYYLARGLGFDRLFSGIFVSVTVLLLSSSPKLREIIWEHIFYYNLGILFFCLGFGLALRLLGDEERRKGFSSYKTRDWIRLAVLILFSFLAATDGLQTLVCLTLPLIGAYALEYYIFSKPAARIKEQAGMSLVLLLILFWSVLGFLMIPVFTRGVEAGYANAYSTYSPMNEWKDNFLGLFHNWLTLFGVSVAKNDPLVSADSVVNMMRIACALVLLFGPFVLLARYDRQKERELRLLIGGHLFVSAFIIFASVFGSLGKANWRLTPMLGSAILVMLTWSLKRLQQAEFKRVGVIFTAFFIAVSALSAVTIARMPANYGENNSWHVAARVLEEKGLTYGYGNFWWSELITLVSGNKVQMANINESKGKPVKNDYQLPSGNFSERVEEKYFLLLTESDNNKMEDWIAKQKKQGSVIDEFTIESDQYSAGGFAGTKVYVYVFDKNIF
ncbi:MAG: hypothetical protein J5493_05375 [Lachnospiraceae bacterium]|nr:hypothetical protein [Lachnospiraceae bacterium]